MLLANGVIIVTSTKLMLRGGCNTRARKRRRLCAISNCRLLVKIYGFVNFLTVDVLNEIFILLPRVSNKYLRSLTIFHAHCTVIMGGQWSQFFPPNPQITEKDLDLLSGKVFLITGGYSGIGLELAKILYRNHGRVYIAGRSEEKARQAIQDIQTAVPSSTRSLEFMLVDLADLTTIKPAVQTFVSKESRLDVLWNNAGISQPPLGSVSAQGIELQLATNSFGPFLLTQLLLPLLQKTAANSPLAGSVRVAWTSSQVVELAAAQGGFTMDEIRNPPKDKALNYTNSKLGNWFLSSELARRCAMNDNGGDDQIISVALNPGAAGTDLFRHTPWLPYLAWPLMYSPVLLAHTELYAGLSNEITVDKSGCYVAPFGRIWDTPRKDLLGAMKLADEEGGSGRASEFWEYCAEVTRDYM